MNAYRIIDNKKKNLELKPEEIHWFIKGVTKGSIPDYQTSALLMAISCNAMTTKETAALTHAMLESGHIFKFKDQSIIDKHSTGGVGDKASFILAPIAAACGVKVPMIAGRSLGHTGGTIDKVESIPGFKTKLSLKRFENLLLKNDLVLMGQTEKIAPADRIIYALRDVTATIDSIPLITASIMSKKLAEGANGIVMDIKTGNGAFMQATEDAQALGRSILKTARAFDKKGVVLITDMNQPLGCYVGNSLEIIESIQTLQNNGPKDLTDLSIELAAHMVFLAEKAPTLKAARTKCLQVLKSGAAYDVFLKLIRSQGGQVKYIQNPELLPVAKIKTEVLATKSGFIHQILTTEVGMKLIDLKGGRKQNTDKVDPSVGMCFHRKIGDKVNKGDSLLTLYHHQSQSKIVGTIVQEFQNHIITIKRNHVDSPKLIKKVMKR